MNAKLRRGEITPAQAQADARILLPQLGFNEQRQFPFLNKLWTRESGWRWNAANASGAYGIPQSLPSSKMASVSPDYRTDGLTQIEWGLGYIKTRYGTPRKAWQHEQQYGWY